MQQTSEISQQKTWTWIRKGNRQIATQNNATGTNSEIANIDKIQQNCKCRSCGARDGERRKLVY